MPNQTFFDGFEKAGQKQQADVARKQLVDDTRRVNAVLYTMGLSYHESIPLAKVDEVLRANGFEPIEDMLLCGREGRLHECVGRNRWLSLTWYKMDVSGRYEVVAYIS